MWCNRKYDFRLISWLWTNINKIAITMLEFYFNHTHVKILKISFVKWRLLYPTRDAATELWCVDLFASQTLRNESNEYSFIHHPPYFSVISSHRVVNKVQFQRIAISLDIYELSFRIFCCNASDQKICFSYLCLSEESRVSMNMKCMPNLKRAPTPHCSDITWALWISNHRGSTLCSTKKGMVSFTTAVIKLL